jgi:DNA polymerase-3 subunit epsilon
MTPLLIDALPSDLVAKLEQLGAQTTAPAIAMPLARPLIVFDVETTGMNPYGDRIIELGAIKQFPDGRLETLRRRFNPGCDIPAVVVAIHGIKNEDVRDEPRFETVAREVFVFFDGCDMGGFGLLKFDVPILREEFRRAGLEWNLKDAHLIDALKVYHMKEPRNLAAALRFYCGEELRDAHSAFADAEATFKVIAGQLRRYQDLPRTLPELDAICNPPFPDKLDEDGKLRWQEGEVVVNFGQKAGIPLRHLAVAEPNFLRWILNKNFSDEVKQIVRDALQGRFPVRDAVPKDDPRRIGD